MAYVLHNTYLVSKFIYMDFIYMCVCTCNFVIELTLKESCRKELWTKSGMLKIPFLFWGYVYTCQNNWLKMWSTQSINQLCCLHDAKQPVWLIFVLNQMNWLYRAIDIICIKNKVDHVISLLKNLSINLAVKIQNL